MLHGQVTSGAFTRTPPGPPSAAKVSGLWWAWLRDVASREEASGGTQRGPQVSPGCGELAGSLVPLAALPLRAWAGDWKGVGEDIKGDDEGKFGERNEGRT